jgi:hypothetical protein
VQPSHGLDVLLPHRPRSIAPVIRGSQRRAHSGRDRRAATPHRSAPAFVAERELRRDRARRSGGCGRREFGGQRGDVSHGSGLVVGAPGDRDWRRWDVGHLDEGEAGPGLGAGDRRGNEAGRSPRASGLEQVVERAPAGAEGWWSRAAVAHAARSRTRLDPRRSRSRRDRRARRIGRRAARPGIVVGQHRVRVLEFTDLAEY